MRPFDVDDIRAQFAALNRTVNGRPAAFLDGPGGTQVPQRVADTVADYLLHKSSNIHGAFATSRDAEEVVDGARRALGDFLGADWREVNGVYVQCAGVQCL